jgi:hypothetical protein
MGALIRVDLPSIPVDLVESATLNIYHGNPYREEIAVHRMLKEWKEKEVTYDRPNTGAASWAGGWVPGSNYAGEPTAKVSISQTGRWYTIDVTADVKAFLSGSTQNHGWFLKSGETIGDDGDATAFVAKEGRVGQRPYVRIGLKKSGFSVSEVTVDGVPGSSGKGDTVRWGPSAHIGIMSQACMKAGGIEENVCNRIIGPSSMIPDAWPTDGPSPLKDIIHGYEHFYDPDLNTGLAPFYCENWSENAKKARFSNDFHGANVSLGYASHFLVDMGMPFHTGEVARQILDYFLVLGDMGKHPHGIYETFVDNNWISEYNFGNITQKDNNWYLIKSPARSTINIARYSHGYLPSIYERIPTNVDSISLKGDKITQKASERCLMVIERNAVGLVQYVIRDK